MPSIRDADWDKPTPGLVQREFTAKCPGAKLVGDIAYICTTERWLYLATVIDCFDNEIIDGPSQR